MRLGFMGLRCNEMSAGRNRSIEYFVDHKMPFIALEDGEVYLASVTELPNQALQLTDNPLRGLSTAELCRLGR